MWLESLSVRGFGCLPAGELRLAPGLTVVSGLNESGKSTLQAALAAALFGYFDGADLRREAAAVRLRDRYAPWGSGPYGLSALVRGRTRGPDLRLEWRFEDRCGLRAYDALTGEELTAQLRGPADGVLDARRVWGIGRDAYLRAFCVRQAELAALDDGDRALRSALEAAAATGGGGSAKRALERLDGALREQIGGRTARQKPLARAEALQAVLAGELRSARLARAELERLAAEHERASTDAQRLGARAAAARRAQASAQLAELQRRQVAAERAEGGIAGIDERIRALPALLPSLAEIGEVERERARLDEAGRSVSGLREEAQAAGLELERIDAELVSARASAASEAAHAGGPDDAALRLLEAAVERRAALADIPTDDTLEVPDLPPMLEALEAQVAVEGARLQRLAGSEGRAPRRGLFVAAGAALAAAFAAATLGSLGAAAALAAVALALCGWGGAALRRGAPGTGLELDKMRERATHAAELRARYEHDLSAFEGRRSERERRVAQARAGLARADAALLAALGPHAVAGVAREDAVAAFRTAAAGRVRHEAALARVDSLASARSAASRPAAAAHTAALQLQHADARLRAAYARHGVHDADAPAAAQAFDAIAAAARLLDELERERAGLCDRLAGLLDGVDLAELGRRALTLAASSGDDDQTLTPSLAAEDVDRLAADAADAAASASELAGRASEAARTLADPAELAEQLAAVSEVVADLTARREILELARTELERAARETYRDVAPALNRALSRGIARVTDGRYREALVGEDFGVRLQSAQRGGLVAADDLSRGTQEQVYLLQRLELASLLSGGETLPVMLDDVLGHADPVRRAALAAVLAEIAASRQVIAFVTDPLAAEALVAAAPGSERIDLPAPVAPDLAMRSVETAA